jgi:hypothetical protein
MSCHQRAVSITRTPDSAFETVVESILASSELFRVVGTGDAELVLIEAFEYETLVVIGQTEAHVEFCNAAVEPGCARERGLLGHRHGHTFGVAVHAGVEQILRTARFAFLGLAGAGVDAIVEQRLAGFDVLQGLSFGHTGCVDVEAGWIGFVAVAVTVARVGSRGIFAFVVTTLVGSRGILAFVLTLVVVTLVGRRRIVRTLTAAVGLVVSGIILQFSRQASSVASQAAAPAGPSMSSMQSSYSSKQASSAPHKPSLIETHALARPTSNPSALAFNGTRGETTNQGVYGVRRVMASAATPAPVGGVTPGPDLL